MNASDRPSASSEARLTPGDFHQYPKDHPLWQDINFTNKWLHERVAAGPAHYAPPNIVSESSALLPHEQREVITAAVARVFLSWAEGEDVVLAYACSAQARQDGTTLRQVAAAMGRPLDQVEGRCTELRRGWEGEAPEKLAAMVAEGRLLASSTYNLRAGSTSRYTSGSR